MQIEALSLSLENKVEETVGLFEVLYFEILLCLCYRREGPGQIMTTAVKSQITRNNHLPYIILGQLLI